MYVHCIVASRYQPRQERASLTRNLTTTPLGDHP
jgi:hypothetical protein